MLPADEPKEGKQIASGATLLEAMKKGLAPQKAPKSEESRDTIYNNASEDGDDPTESQKRKRKKKKKKAVSPRRRGSMTPRWQGASQAAKKGSRGYS